MMSLLMFKEQLKRIYMKCDFYINPIIKFCFSFLTFFLLNINIGFMSKLKHPMITLVLSLLCSFLPYGAVAFLGAAFMLLHLSAVSFELTVITFVFFLIIALLYYGLQPRDSYLLLLTPMMFVLRIPYVIPLLVGLSGGIYSIIPVSCGVFIYYLLLYVKQNAGVLTNDATVDIAQKYVQVIKNIMSNQTMMMIMIAAFAIAIVLVFLIKNLSVDYSWLIAIVIGSIAQLIVVFIGDYTMDITVPIGQLLLGILISGFIAIIYDFFVFSVDYSRTEYTQFEDDDYYYYVKAVPKLVVTTPDVKVKKINSRKL